MLCYAMLCYAKSRQSCPTLCNPIDSSPPGSFLTHNCQSNPEDQEQSRRQNPPRLHTALQSYSIQNKEVLAQKQAWGTMEQNTDSRHKPTHLWSINLWQTNKNIQWGKVSTATGDEEVGQPQISLKLESTHTPTKKRNWRWLADLNRRHHTTNSERKMNGNILCQKFSHCFLTSCSQGSRKINKLDLIKSMAFCAIKRKSIIENGRE